jgi:hypothetical protein
VRAKLVGLGIITAVGGALLRLAVDQEAGGRALPLSLPARLGEIGPQFLMGFSPPAGRASLLLGIASIAVSGFLLLSRGVRAERRGAALAVAGGLSGVGLPLVLAFAGLDYLITRNVIGALIPLALAVAAGLGASRAGLLGLTAGALFAAVSISIVFGVRNDPLAQRPPWAEVAETLRRADLPRAIVLAQKGTWATPLAIHMPRTWRLPASGARVAEIQFLRRLPTPRDCRRPKAWWGPLCAIHAEQSRRLTLPKSFRLVSTHRVAGFEILRFRSPRAVHIHSLRRRVIGRHPSSRAPGARPSNVLLTPTKSPLDQ